MGILLSVELSRRPVLLVTEMTMHWPKMSTVPTNELIHTRLWTDVVDVEITTFEWVNWWNESRLHQSLGYRTPAEVEADFWEHHPSREIMGIKAQA